MKIYSVLYVDQSNPGPASDGSHIFRSDDKREAERFSVGKIGYGSKPATVDTADVPVLIARRWGF
jgi:hypothetical protein